MKTRPRSRLALIAALPKAYRLYTPRAVTELRVFYTAFGTTGYYVCPGCGVTLEREFVNFCDRCGQRLDWDDYESARIIYPKDRDVHS